MTYYPTTPLPHYSTKQFNFHLVEEIICSMWCEYLQFEYSFSQENNLTKQRLEFTAAVIDYWEEILSEINDHEIQKRRLSGD